MEEQGWDRQYPLVAPTIYYIPRVKTKTSLTDHFHILIIALNWSLYLGSKWSPIEYHCNNILTP